MEVLLMYPIVKSMSQNQTILELSKAIANISDSMDHISHACA